MNTDTLQRNIPQHAASTPPPSAPLSNGPSSTDAVRFEADSIKKSTGEQVRQVAGDIREGGEEALKAAKDASVDLVSNQKEKIASKLDEYSSAVKAACESLKSDDNNPLAAPAERASIQLDRAVRYLRDHEPSDFLDDLGHFARRRPEIVYGALFIAGLASVRFLKASTRDRQQRNLSPRSVTGPNSVNQVSTPFTP